MPFAHCDKTDEVYLLQVRITITLLVEFFSIAFILACVSE